MFSLLWNVFFSRMLGFGWGPGAGATAGAVGAGTAGTIAGIVAGPPTVAAMGIGAGRKTANSWNKSFHDPMVAQLGSIQTPDDLLNWWQQYLTNAQQFVGNAPGGPMGPFGREASKVIQGALSTPEFLQTVDTMWNQLGGPQKYGMPSLSSTVASSDPSLGGGYPRNGGWNIGDVINKGIEVVKNLPRTGGGPPGTNDPPTDVNEPGGTNPGTKTKAPAPWPTGDSNSGTRKGIPAWLLAALGGGSALGEFFGAKTAADASTKAAQLQADAANRALDLNRDMYNQSRSDMLPWLNVGANSLYRLSDLMGLPQTQNFSANPSFPALANGANPSAGNPNATPLNAGNPNNAPASPLQNVADRYHQFWSGRRG